MQSIYELKLNREYIIELKRLKEGEKISLVSDTMFEVMLNNEDKIKYAVFLISRLLNLDETLVKDNIRLKKPELNKERTIQKGRRVDFVAEIGNKIINIEMNNNFSYATLVRNVKYATDLYQYGIKRGEEYNISQAIVQINLNNFSYGENSPAIETFCLMSNKRNNSLLHDFQIINIYLPEIRRKYYNKDELTEVEKMLLVMMTSSIEESKKIGKGNLLMEEYVKDSEMASNTQDIMGVYDKELDDKMIRAGERKEFYLKGKQEIAKKMLDEKEPIEKIILYTGLTELEIKRLA